MGYDRSCRGDVRLAGLSFEGDGATSYVGGEDMEFFVGVGINDGANNKVEDDEIWMERGEKVTSELGW